MAMPGILELLIIGTVCFLSFGVPIAVIIALVVVLNRSGKSNRDDRER